MALPGLHRDPVVISRAVPAVDAEGNAVDAESAVFRGSATLGKPSARDLDVANARGQQLDAVLAIRDGVDVRLSDSVDVRGHRYSVVSVTDNRIHQRAFLRRVSA